MRRTGLRCEDCRKRFASLTVVSISGRAYLEICKGCFTSRETIFAKSMRQKPRPYRACIVYRGGATLLLPPEEQ